MTATLSISDAARARGVSAHALRERTLEIIDYKIDFYRERLAAR